MLSRYVPRRVPTGIKTSTRGVWTFTGKHKRSARVDIVSQELCDTALNRLRSTLPAPNTCDIIDINPGRGLWSQKIHNLLNPRRHVLVEPDFVNYSPYLAPLLQGKDTVYRHATLLEDAFNPRNKLLSDYPAAIDPLQCNQTLLLTVNLSGTLLKTSVYTGSPARRFFADLYLSLWKSRTNIHRYGLVRVLAWVPDDEKDAYIPRTVNTRRKQAVMLEGGYSIKEIAGGSDNTRSSLYRRWREIEVEDRARVAALEQAAGIETPETRRDQLPPPDLLSIDPTVEAIQKGKFISNAQWVPNFLKLDEYLRKEHPEHYEECNKKRRYEGPGGHLPELREWQMLRTQARTQHKTHMRAVDLVKDQRLLDLSWKKLMIAAESHRVNTQERQLRTRAEALGASILRLNRTNRLFVTKAVDDYRALDMSPPVLSWNRREAEPVLVHAEDFVPSHDRLALLDLTPRQDFLAKIDTIDKMVYFGHVLRDLFLRPSRSVYDALKMLVHEGVDEFIKAIPGLHDPTKGGWYDLSALRVRSLPTEMVVDIALAYTKWPFRRSTESILMWGEDPQSVYIQGVKE
ncbi:hypothetical protein LTR47_010155 [Exophiala xenobiotica]|nr:hypothetical protein LTR41_008478 [Exophiala xenobiotica]KAK5217003.1 hypothetical protein LTR72_009998 [Exophiala xenobiotica]KAK5223423.1 hypothetical protein LTR47_010155 [Exophiala xenobiotica]KAK5251366.1 hypothetical protein LTS06_003927 [Exophiala xenobiotica]KAK5287666.1 hypothetical protein LTR14_008896 [Exophiala xenobiotica]